MQYALLFLAIVVTGIFYFPFTTGDLATGFTSDDAVYLLLADLYTFSDMTHLPVYRVIREQALFPPLFPLLLGLLGGGSDDPAQGALIATSLLLFSILLAGYWFFQQTRNLTLAISLTSVMTLLPGTQVFAQEIWSEFLLMALLYAIFIIANRDVLQKHHWLILAVLIALATLTRTAGIALLPPFLLLLYRYRVKPFWAPVAISILPFLLWYAPREVMRGSPGYTSTFISTFNNTEAASILERITNKLTSMFESGLWLFSGIDSGPVHTWFGRILLLGILILAGRILVRRSLEFRLDALFCFTYGCIVFVWPYDDVYYVSRFLYPLIPVLLLYTAIGILELTGERISPALAIALFASVVVISGPGIKQFTERAYARVAPELEPYRHDRQWLLSDEANQTILQNTQFIVETLQKIPESIAEDECIYALQAPLVMLYTRRISGILPSPGSSDEQFRRETAVCGYILALPITVADSNQEYYPLQRLNASGYEQTVFYSDQEAGYGTAVYLLRKIADTIGPK